MEFDLVSRPWIPVVGRDGSFRDVGLAEVLQQAHALRRIVGETPTVTAALYRLVLAVAYRVFAPGDANAWGVLWRAEALPDEPVREYFRRWGERFDLFGKRPFLQSPEVAGIEASSAAKLVVYRAAGNNTTLFDHTTSADRVLLGAAEAARWLVTLQAYDPGGLKTPYRNDKSSEAAPCNGFGVVLVEGATLRETLLLNLVCYSSERERPFMTSNADHPAWESDDSPGAEPKQRFPRGWADLLTWPSRRVWLSRSHDGDESMVDGVVITPGTRLDVDLSDCEWMAAFWRPAPRGKRGTLPPLLPVRLVNGRGVWRHAQELLLAGERRKPESGPVRQGSGTLERRRPLALDHIAEMTDLGNIAEDAVYTLRVFGQQLDRNKGIAEAAMEEAVAAPVALMRAEDPRVGRIIGLAVQLGDELGAELRRMGRDYRAVFGGEFSADLELGYWPLLPAPFNVLLRDLATAVRGGRSELPAAKAWAEMLRATALGVADRWAYSTPRRGRNLLAVGEYYDRFTFRQRNLIKIYESRLAAFVNREESQ